jgi:uncharacterized protein (AIM24 family)
VRDQLLGTTQPLLSISLEAGESVVAAAGGFAWMTDSIAIAARDGAQDGALALCVYTATDGAGVVGFAPKLPGSILCVDLSDHGYLVHKSGFLAGTPSVGIAADQDNDLLMWRITGTGAGRAWVELPGDVVIRELSAGHSLRVHPRHIGMVDASVAVQVTELPGIADDGSHAGPAYLCAVLSGPGKVWLQSMPVSPGETPPHSNAGSLRTRDAAVNAENLARRAFVTPQTMNQVLRELEERRWVTRHPHPGHRRILQADLTQDGRGTLRACHRAAAPSRSGCWPGSAPPAASS